MVIGRYTKTHEPHQICSADEISIFYRTMPKRTLEFENVNCHGGKKSKKRLPALVCRTQTGTGKLPLSQAMELNIFT